MTAEGNMSGVGMLSQHDVFWPSSIFQSSFSTSGQILSSQLATSLLFHIQKCLTESRENAEGWCAGVFFSLSTQTRCGGLQDALRCHRWAPLTLMDKHFIGLNAARMFATGVYLICVIAELCYKIWMRCSVVTQALFPTFAERCFASDKIFMGKKLFSRSHTCIVVTLIYF